VILYYSFDQDEVLSVCYYLRILYSRLFLFHMFKLVSDQFDLIVNRNMNTLSKGGICRVVFYSGENYKFLVLLNFFFAVGTPKFG